MDGAPAHTTNVTLVAMSQAMAEVGGELLGKSDWPVDSPDRSPLDFMAWDTLWRAVCGPRGVCILEQQIKAVRVKYEHLLLAESFRK